jgi:rhodanese-related sulfurtransferase
MMDLFRKVSETSAEAVRQKLEAAASGDFTLLDVREPAEYEKGHLPGAVHIPLSRLADRLGELDRSKPLVTY